MLDLILSAHSLTICAIGKILQDSQTVEHYKIEEKGFIVCMVTKVCAAACKGFLFPFLQTIAKT